MASRQVLDSTEFRYSAGHEAWGLSPAIEQQVQEQLESQEYLDPG